MKKAIVLASGGMDSAVTLAIAKQEYEVYPLHVNYRHRTEKKEREAFYKLANHYGLKKIFIEDIDYLGRIGGSSLTDSSRQPERGEPHAGEVPSSYVPFRNTHLLSIAVSYAEVLGAEAIFIGAAMPDSSGYPDCTKEYIEAFNNLIRIGSKHGKRIRVIAPLIEMGKKDIVQRGNELEVPFELTWSCYLNNPEPCGECQSCFLRLKGFREAGLSDPARRV